MLKKIIRAIFKAIQSLVIVAVLVLILPRLATGLYAWKRTYEVSTVPTQKVVIVFGAGLTRSGEATPILKDRVETAAQLYFSGKAAKLLMSGDNRFLNYNEPEAMRQYALALRVPDTDIVLDYAGRRTYDTCYRAKAIFGVTKVILVTQQFHLPRAIFLCNMLGVDGTGVAADNLAYRKRSLLYWNLRELPATVTAFADLVTRPLPVLGNPESIFSENNQ
jgi:SanA protein